MLSGRVSAANTPRELVGFRASAPATLRIAVTRCGPSAQSQVPVPGSHVPLQQSLSCEHPSPDCAPDMPPQVPSHVPQSEPQQSPSAEQVDPSMAQPQAPSTHWPPQQSLSWPQLAPSAAPVMPPQVLSHVPQDPPQQSLSWPQLAPSAAPDMPPQVLSHVPQPSPLQQSESIAQVPPLIAQPHVPLAQAPVQQSLSAVQLSPSWAPDMPPQVLSQVPHVGPPQQSLSDWQLDPVVHGGPQVPLLQTKESALQQSASVVQLSPCSPQLGAAQAPLVHTDVPQQSLSSAQVSPVLPQPQVPPLVQMLGAQQSLLAVHEAPEAWHPQVMLVESQVSEPQQSLSAMHPCPLEAQTPPSPPPAERHVMLDASQVKPEQHPGADGSQSPSCPAHAAWHLPLTQLFEQQSPLAVQQSSSSWQFGSEREQEPPLLELLEVLVWPLLELEVLVWPLLLELLPLPLVADPHLPAEHESEQHWA